MSAFAWDKRLFCCRVVLVQACRSSEFHICLCQQLVVDPGGSVAQVPLFKTSVVNGERTVTGIEPVFQSRLNPGNSFLVIIEVSSRGCLSSICC